MLGLMIMTVLIAACGGTEETTTTAPGATNTTASAAPVKLGVIISSPAVMPFYEAYVAKTQDFFSKQNLDVSILEVDGAEATTTAFASGQGQIMQSDLNALNPTALAAVGADKPIMFLMFMTTPFSIYVPEDSPIKTPQDLDGKVIAVNSEQDPGMSLIKTMNLEFKINAKFLVVNRGCSGARRPRPRRRCCLRQFFYGCRAPCGRGHDDAQHHPAGNG